MLLKKEEVVELFQKINETGKTKEDLGNKKNILANVISKKYICLYIVTLMVSLVQMEYNFSPFSLAIIVAAVSSEVPIIAVLLLALTGNAVSYGLSGSVSFIVTLLIFLATFFIKEPKYNDSSRNEKVLLSKRIFFASLIVNVIQVFINQFLIYDLLVAISMSIVTVIFYKIFANSIQVLVNYNEKMAFSIEEVMGTSLLLSIALCSLGDFAILGFGVRNVLSIFIVLVLGWKNGILVGTTSGATIGVTLGIIANNEPVVVAAYAISGMIAGILNKFGKIGVICGFVLGNVILSYVANGLVSNLILFKEILIAGIALLVVPKNINLSIENVIGEKKFLPVGANRGLNRSKETITKLNNMSNTVKDMAEAYKNVAATVIDEEDIREKNKQTFISELLNNTQYMQENIIYESIQDVEGPIVDEIFNKLMQKQQIKEKDIIKILAQNNNYVIGLGSDEEKIDQDLQKMTEAINLSFRISKMSFIWNERLKEEKKNFEAQLNGVSKAISDIAKTIDEEIKSDDLNPEQKEKIVLLLKQKEILVQEILIDKKENDRYKIQLYIEKNQKDDIDEIIVNMLNKVLEEKVAIQEEKEIKEENLIKYTIISEDKYILDIGQSIAIKDGMPVSGDCMLQTKLKDGKYLIAISDGMGSGPEAKKSSQIVISMLKRLLNSGFERETSVDLINSSLLNISEDVFATLDIAIVDLYMGNVEFIKNGACPTYIKNNRKIQIIKSLTLPTGVVKDATADVFDKDIESNDIILMCSDGILDSNVEYKNKELWIKYLLEDIEITNPQKIADIILNESIDNTFGKVKDDMTVVVFKFIKKN